MSVTKEGKARAGQQPNPIVFFDITIGGQPAGRIKMELFADKVPRTAENFRQFCTGEYKIIKEFMVQGGDFIKGDGTGSMSIYGSKFDDEDFSISHDKAGLLSMFFITCNECKYLDGKHVVFGKVIDGFLTLRKMEMVPTGLNNRPKLPVVISECGEM
ncbi:Peptidyl-prolyl cis-trans isomerase-like 1 [Spiromyces aspiralis]|uniref:Peptidyl-prolyl cis-trans isomerase-like 1 n=1 Tax=Spiromyces aspiralis TaxID=68401 RepID=A0ACC1HD14_9FUNG|nr:Peptidyl-prolyl cis-trans isomerase-like 1 [Spiromyces aspiralis]